MNNPYYLLCKTGDAEFRCLENLSPKALNILHPIIEITRGRKIRNKEEYPINGKVERICNIFKGHSICIDVTSNPRLSSPETDSLYDPTNGYQNWCNLTLSIKDKIGAGEVVPCILANFNDSNFISNYRIQVENLTRNFKAIAYRSSIKDDGYLDDLSIIKPYLHYKGQCLFIIDCEFLPSGSLHSFVNKIISRIQTVSKFLNDCVQFTICGTSFPNNVGEIGNDHSDSLKIYEIDLYKKIKESISPDIIIHYGDYGSIGPQRNDDIVMAHGWIPRIDVPTESEIYYYRERCTLVRKYAETYMVVAKSAMEDSRFPATLSCWGISQIKTCAEKGAPGSSPSFWISVRMNIYIEQQKKRLKYNS